MSQDGETKTHKANFLDALDFEEKVCACVYQAIASSGARGIGLDKYAVGVKGGFPFNDTFNDEAAGYSFE